MTNWCYNIINFEGEAKIIKQLKNLFLSLAEKEKKDVCGHLPGFIQARDGHLFSIRWEDDILYYETKWSPNLEIIKQVAEKFKVDYTHSYEEMGCLIYGEASYKKEVFTDVFLDAIDFDSYVEIEGGNKWIFENNIYESDIEILEILLERKIEIPHKLF
jgi:hypothetical protein